MDRAILCQLLFIFSNQQKDRTCQLDSLFSIIHPFSLLKQHLRGAERTEKPCLAKMSKQWNLKKFCPKKTHMHTKTSKETMNFSVILIKADINAEIYLSTPILHRIVHLICKIKQI